MATRGSGGSCLVKATSAESTLGTGQNTLRGTGPARRIDANQASFTGRHAVDPLPGDAVNRSATSACTMTRPLRSEGTVLEQVQQHRHRHVVGQVGDQRGGRRAAARRRTPRRR